MAVRTFSLLALVLALLWAGGACLAQPSDVGQPQTLTIVGQPLRHVDIDVKRYALQAGDQGYLLGNSHNLPAAFRQLLDQALQERKAVRVSGTFVRDSRGGLSLRPEAGLSYGLDGE